MAERVHVVNYDPAWPQRFREIAARLRGALGETALRIDHIGSTAVPGLDAKPIIDIQVSVADFEPLDVIREPLEQLGYVFRHANPDLTKRYFREGPGQLRTHIHVRRHGGWGEQVALLFRDYLRVHNEAAARYAALKHVLAEQYGEDREGYTNAKRPFTWEILAAANDWSQATGWCPGPSDA